MDDREELLQAICRPDEPLSATELSDVAKQSNRACVIGG